MVIRHVATGLSGLAVSCAVLGTIPAHAGGAWLHFDRTSYAPGDTATAVSCIGYEHNADLGGPQDGPYYAYLARGDQQSSFADGLPVTAGASRLGEVAFRTGPVREPGSDVLCGPHHATTTFRVPDLAPGDHQLLVCNDPCRKPMADLLGGTLTVSTPLRLSAGGADESPREPLVVAATAALAVLTLALAVTKLRRDKAGAVSY